MVDQLINLVKENAGDVINNNPEIPADKKEQAAEVTGTSIASGLQDMLAKGGVKDVMKLFAGGDAAVSSSPVTQHVNESVTNNLASKLGLSTGQAGGIASALIPSILGKLVNKTNDPNDKSFDLQDIFNQLSGGKTSGLNMGSILSKFKGGLDKDADGDVDLDDLKSLFGGGGGIMDKVKGMFN